VLILLSIVSIIFILFSSLPRPNPFPTNSSTAYTSISQLSVYDFSLHIATACGYDNANGLKFLSVSEFLHNDKNMTFHLLSAKIVFLNYSLANGTVVTVNREWMDNNQTFATTSHDSNFLAYLAVLKTGPRILSAEFIVTAQVRELAEPFVQVVNVNAATLNC
jgi:hypothetical protein